MCVWASGGYGGCHPAHPSLPWCPGDVPRPVAGPAAPSMSSPPSPEQRRQVLKSRPVLQGQELVEGTQRPALLAPPAPDTLPGRFLHHTTEVSARVAAPGRLGPRRRALSPAAEATQLAAETFLERETPEAGLTPSLGSVTLDWCPPTQVSGGTPGEEATPRAPDLIGYYSAGDKCPGPTRQGPPALPTRMVLVGGDPTWNAAVRHLPIVSPLLHPQHQELPKNRAPGRGSGMQGLLLPLQKGGNPPPRNEKEEPTGRGSQTSPRARWTTHTGSGAGSLESGRGRIPRGSWRWARGHRGQVCKFQKPLEQQGSSVCG